MEILILSVLFFSASLAFILCHRANKVLENEILALYETINKELNKWD